jgi:hypothetical protein
MLMEFTMFKWKPPMGISLVLVEKGHLAKIFEPYQSKTDLEHTTFNNVGLSKWYNGIIDTTQRLCIL